MPIFTAQKNKLTQIKEKKISLEKDIQNITEQNLETIFGYQFISTEVQLNNLRIDSLAFDTETNAFIIIEYKKDRNFSVVDQGYAYLALMLNNKADFILEYNEKMTGNLKKGEVDWSQSRVVFISPQFTTYQKGAIDFKDLPIELWEIKLYENNTVLFNPLKSAATSESIKTVSKDKTIAQVSKEVKEWTVDDHFKDDWTHSREIYEIIRDKIMALDERIMESPVKQYIGFKIDNKNVVEAHVYKSKITISLLRVKPKDLHDPERKTVYVKDSMKWYKKHITDIAVKSKKDINYAIDLVKQVYEKFNQ